MQWCILNRALEKGKACAILYLRCFASLSDLRPHIRKLLLAIFLITCGWNGTEEVLSCDGNKVRLHHGPVGGDRRTVAGIQAGDGSRDHHQTGDILPWGHGVIILVTSDHGALVTRAVILVGGAGDWVVKLVSR